MSRKGLRAAGEGWESPGETRFGSSRVVTVTYQTLSRFPQRAPVLRLLGWRLQTQKGRSAGRGGSCPTSKVWVWSAMRSSYESSNWHAYFGDAPGRGMTRCGSRQLSAVSYQLSVTPIAARNLAAHYPLATSHYPLPLSSRPGSPRRPSGETCCCQAASQPKSGRRV